MTTTINTAPDTATRVATISAERLTIKSPTSNADTEPWGVIVEDMVHTMRQAIEALQTAVAAVERVNRVTMSSRHI
jgi:hypothetical protein